MKYFIIPALMLFLSCGGKQQEAEQKTTIQENNTSANEVSNIQTSNVSPSLKKINTADLPKTIKVKGGKPTEAYSFEDKNGLHYLVFSDFIPAGQEVDSNNKLYYTELFNHDKQVWEQKDNSTQMEYFPPLVTDIDKNGIAEIWVSYNAFISSDGGFANKKVIMHEGTTKYAIRGKNYKGEGDNMEQTESYTISENTFKSALKGFEEQALKLYEQKAAN